MRSLTAVLPPARSAGSGRADRVMTAPAPSRDGRDIHESRAIAAGAAIAVLMVPLLLYEGAKQWGSAERRCS